MGVIKPASNSQRRLAERLQAAGVLSEEQVAQAMRLVASYGQRIEDLLVEIGFVAELDLLKVLSTMHSTHFVSSQKLFHAQIDPRILALVPYKIAKAHCLFPVMYDGANVALVVATPEPDNLIAIQDLKLATGVREVRPVAALPAAVNAAIARAYANDPRPFELLMRAAAQAPAAMGSAPNPQATPNHQTGPNQQHPAQPQRSSSGQWFEARGSIHDVAESSGERATAAAAITPHPPPAAQAPQHTPSTSHDDPFEAPTLARSGERPSTPKKKEPPLDSTRLEGHMLGGRYTVVRRLGEGGMGMVYEGKHLGTNRRVAIKILPSALAEQASFVSRFEIEAKAAGQIESRHIAQVFDVGVAGSNPYLVMEYLDGEDLQQLIKRVGALPRDIAIRIVAQACAGLMKAHEAGIIHRDIKPANIFLARQDGDIVVKLVDFGIAKVQAGEEVASAGLTSPGKVVGSPFYMSPEQIRAAAKVDHRTDIWSIGVVLYECLSGTTPFYMMESLPQIVLAICTGPAPNLAERAPWVTPDVLMVTNRALQLDATRRYPSANEMWSALRALSPGGTTIDESMIAQLRAR